MVGFGLEPNVSPWQLPVGNSHPQYAAMIYKHLLPRGGRRTGSDAVGSHLHRYPQSSDGAFNKRLSKV